MAMQHEILDILDTLTSVYGQEPGDTRGYYWALEDYPADLIQEAAREHVRLSKWYPKPSELREIADRIQAKRDQGEEPRRIYWQAMDLFKMLAAGKIEQAQFDGDSAVKYLRKQRGDRSWWASDEGAQDKPAMLHHFAPDDIIQYDADGYPIEFEFEEAIL